MSWHMRPLPLVLGLIGVMIAPHAGNAQFVDDPFSDYLQRSVTISLGAGNAKDTNAAIHMINPWPPYVGDRRIHIQGRQAVDSVERMYKFPKPFEQAGGSAGETAAPAGTMGSGLGAPVTPMQPISSGN
jgi:hypothetical protein